jgi:hypothetical protein
MTTLVEQQLKRHLKQIMGLCEQTRKTRVEHGFAICYGKDLSAPQAKTPQRTYIKGRCKGNKCEVESKDCGTTPNFANCHSHPMGATNMPSSQDVILSIHRREQAFCICAPMRGKDALKCYELTTDQNTKDRYIQAYLQHDDNTMMDMIVKSIFRPDDTTRFRPIIDIVKKRKK